MYRLGVRIGTTFTSARYEMAEESAALHLSPIARDFPSAQFVTGGRVQVDRLAEALRGIVGTATKELGEHPGSVDVTYPASWDSRQLLLLWEALVLAGIPDAATRPITDPKPTRSFRSARLTTAKQPLKSLPLRVSPLRLRRKSQLRCPRLRDAYTRGG